MIKEITMPAGGQTTDTSTVGTWLVKKGDKVKRGDMLLEIETDKATLTVESFAKGTVLALLVEEGDRVSAGKVIAYIGDESDLPEVEAKLGRKADVQADVQIQKEESPDTGREEAPQREEYQPIDKKASALYTPAPAREETGPALSDIKAMPNAKLLAREEGISLEAVAAYVKKDILKRQDVEKYMDDGAPAKSTGAKPDKADASYTEVPLSQMRKTIARRMLESTQNIPSFQATVEVKMEQCITLRKMINDNKEGKKVSYNDILFKCIEAAIRKYPYVNASYTDTAILLHHNVNIGLAVSVDAGLVVPVVKQVNKKTIAQISEVNQQNIGKAREGSLLADEMSGGTITLSNLGMYPITQFNAIINPPEVCILAVGAAEEKPEFIDGQWKTVQVMKITGSFDHRVVDGAYGAEFLTELKRIIESPALAL
ncbi:dihydrolipoamide acetyltransferase family protein [Faecalicatena contorta]|uniref:Dihydrolipoamide acetyltransferase component of pyruvate dehydrogenase complex n=1 Tax=Faecalicatena contorta TaxID=39482 RepID=A0A315ZQI4_9FIRM|nr:dihydrolipoamide acetyltransferase family protein [Faecalicatena contorta]PWJ47158.1 pyruvate dehydrogenase E2 component (dihydrolipoamide acetyltransferase) [Faecalicatena contorta]SUQ16133.1 pyruvate dehydrogenase E2 component (dihydrolipoamide acetyltransferase) [Faecalicatena contorta]